MKYLCMSIARDEMRAYNVDIMKHRVPDLYVQINDSKNAYGNFLEGIARFPEEDLVFMEDDVKLCKNFKELLEAELVKYPNQVVQFFNPRNHDTTITMKGRSYAWTQCVFLPRFVINKVIELADEFLVKYPQNRTGYDLLIGYALGKLKIDYISIRPCLVQHLDYKSAINSTRSTKRQTPYFIDDLKKKQG